MCEVQTCASGCTTIYVIAYWTCPQWISQASTNLPVWTLLYPVDNSQTSVDYSVFRTFYCSSVQALWSSSHSPLLSWCNHFQTGSLTLTFFSLLFLATATMDLEAVPCVWPILMGFCFITSVIPLVTAVCIIGPIKQNEPFRFYSLAVPPWCFLLMFSKIHFPFRKFELGTFLRCLDLF